MKLETNTVIIPLAQYNELRDIKEALDKGDYVSYSTYMGSYYSYKEVDVVRSLSEQIEQYKLDAKKLKDIIYFLENPNDKKPINERLKEMNLFQLIKWYFKK